MASSGTELQQLSDRRRAALRATLDGLRISTNAAAKAAGISEGTLRNFLKGGAAKSMTLVVYDKMAIGLRRAGYEVTLGQLLGEAVAPADPGKTQRVSVVGNVQAGLFREHARWPPDEQFEIDVPVDPRYEREPKEALRVVGPSMNQVYPEGSFIVVVGLSEDWTPRQGQHLVVRRRDKFGEIEHTVKELRRDEAGRPWLWPRSDHPDFQQPWPLPSPEDGDGSLEVAGIVIGSYRPE